MASASGVTAVPLTNTAGVALTPSASARAVTYGGQSRYIPLSRQAENPSLRPTSRPIPASSALLRPGTALGRLVDEQRVRVLREPLAIGGAARCAAARVE